MNVEGAWRAQPNWSARGSFVPLAHRKGCDRPLPGAETPQDLGQLRPVDVEPERQAVAEARPVHGLARRVEVPLADSLDVDGARARGAYPPFDAASEHKTKPGGAPARPCDFKRMRAKGRPRVPPTSVRRWERSQPEQVRRAQGPATLRGAS